MTCTLYGNEHPTHTLVETQWAMKWWENDVCECGIILFDPPDKDCRYFRRFESSSSESDSYLLTPHPDEAAVGFHFYHKVQMEPDEKYCCVFIGFEKRKCCTFFPCLAIFLSEHSWISAFSGSLLGKTDSQKGLKCLWYFRESVQLLVKNAPPCSKAHAFKGQVSEGVKCSLTENCNFQNAVIKLKAK